MKFNPFRSMDKFLIIGFVLLTYSCQANQGEPASGSNGDSETLEQGSAEPRIAIDVGLIVKDMDRSLAFYRDLMGLEFVADIRTSLMGKGRMVQLRHGESLIKLVQMDDTPGTNSSEGLTSSFGYRYATFMTTDMARIKSIVDNNQIPIFLPLTTLGNGAQILMVEDPEGNIVEFVQEA